MKRFSIILIVFAFFGLASCANEADPAADKSYFVKFYDNSDFALSYTPLDAVQTSDGGYIILALKSAIDSTGARVDDGNIYLMKTDEFGAFKSEQTLPNGLNYPAPSLLTVAGKFYFFCMKKEGSSIQLMEVDETGKIAQQIEVGGTYPLAAGVDGTNLLLLSYDQGNRQSVISLIGTDGGVQKSKAFTIGAGDGPEGPIIDHILRRGRQFPFQVGKTSTGLYFFNGFYEYTLSMVFTDLNADSPAGFIQGNQAGGGITRALPLNGGKYAVARFNYGDNYLIPNATLSTSGVTSAVNLEGYSFPELTPYAPVSIIGTTINGSDKIIYGSSTRGKQIALFGYNPADGTFVGSRYMGFSNSFEIASLTRTSDDGLLVLGTTYIAGRFPRICLFKLSAEALGKSFK